MKASPEKSAHSVPASLQKKPAQPYFAKVGGGEFFAPAKPLKTPSSDLSGRMFRTQDGKLVELPPEITWAKAVILENEAIAAVKKLGKGPPKKPLPVPKLQPRYQAKKSHPEIPARAKKGVSEKTRIALSQSALSSSFKSISKSKVSQFLISKGLPVLVKGLGLLQKLKHNEQTHDNAADMQKQSESAVVIPPSEGQAKSNFGQVTEVSAYPSPVADETKAKQKLLKSLQGNIPQTVEEVDDFKRDQKAQNIGAEVLQVVQCDNGEVTSSFGAMNQTPPPAPPDHTPEPLPSAEMQQPAMVMNLGEGAVAPLQEEHTDVSNFVREADGKLNAEGISQEQLDMVDEGDLAKANKEKKGIEQSAKNQPMVVQDFARLQARKVDEDLSFEEKKEREDLKTKRKNILNNTTEKKKTLKGALEKKRAEVAERINGIFISARDKIEKKLASLEKDSMKRFDKGNASASQNFEANVKTGIDAFKAKRYSGFFGWAKKAKDWLLGIDEMPEVKAIFEGHRTTFINTVNKLIEDITADNKRVIVECKGELDKAKKEIKEYVSKLDPSLKDIGQQAAGEMKSKLLELDQLINDKEKELQNKLKEKQQAAIKAIDEKIEKMKAAMSGALSMLGKLLLEAARKFFTWALQKFGYSLAEIDGVINKGAAVLKAIFTKPIQFVKNLVNAATLGFKNFGKNFLTHLKDALFNWLTGSLSGIRLPATWDLKGIASVALQLVGISYENIRAHLVKIIPEPVVATLETTFTLVKTLVTDGPMAAWEQLKEMAGELKDAFVDAAKEWVRNTIVIKAIETIASMLIPGAGIIRAMVGIYDTVVFFIQKAKDIAQMVGNFLSSIGEIAMGNVSAAAGALENGLAMALSLVINFLAKFLHLDGITEKIKKAIQKVRGKVDAMMAKVAKWIAQKASNLIGKVKKGASKLFKWWEKQVPFTSGNGKSHSIYSRESKVVVESTPTYLDELIGKIKEPSLKKRARELQKKIEEIIRTGSAAKDDTAINQKTKDLELNLKQLSLILDQAGVLENEEVMPSPEYTYSTENGKAKRAVVKNLSTMRQWGSIPGSANPAGWKYAQSIGKTTSWPRFTRLHLINERFGGAGMNSNLAVAGKDDNRNHLDTVEKEIKKFVGDTPNEKDKESVLDYTVEVEYGRPATPLQHKGVKANLSDYPSKFICTWTFVEKWSKKKSESERAKEKPGNQVPIIMENWENDLTKSSA